MCTGYKFRDFFFPRGRVLEEAGIKPGFHVLDYGCGCGSYVVPLAKLVGESGRVYALDIHPVAIRKVQHIARKNRLVNVVTIRSDCQTGLADTSVDAVLLYDVFHHFSEPDRILKELYRILKPGGVLSFSDHHMKESEILAGVTGNGLFRLLRRGKRTYTFVKQVS
jgi:ubiquinone/menaquinone biosynthesis C-methylase UbiE